MHFRSKAGFTLLEVATVIVIITILLRWLDRGKLISPASARIGGTELDRLLA